jgi:hypothetical protein
LLRQWKGDLRLGRGRLADENSGQRAGRRECDKEPFHDAVPGSLVLARRVYQEKDARTVENLRRPQ